MADTPDEYKADHLSQSRSLFNDGKYVIDAGEHEGRPYLRAGWLKDITPEHPPSFRPRLVPEFLEIPVLIGLLNECVRNPHARGVNAEQLAKELGAFLTKHATQH